MTGRRIRRPDTVRLVKEENSPFGEEVLVQNSGGEPKWLDGTVTEQPGSVSYKVLVGEQLWKRRVDQMHQNHLSKKETRNQCNTFK